MDPITVPNSVYIDGQWHAATWLAEIVDDSTGELIITATIEDPARVAALSLTNDMLRALRTQAGFTGPTPSQRADRTAAELAYWRRSVEHCVDVLMAPARQTGGDPRHALVDAESYLRNLLVGDDAPRYDCRTTGERLAVQEDRLQILSDTMRRIVADIDRRLDAMETISRDIKPVLESYENSLNDLVERMVAIERLAQGIVDEARGSTMPLQVKTRSVLGLNHSTGQEAGL